jgi:hypothetical protein
MGATTTGYKPSWSAQKYLGTSRNPEDLIVKPVYEQYLVKHPEMTANRSVFRRVMEEMTKKPRDRRRSFSASSAGYCLRRQELAFLGQRKNPISEPRLIRIFNNGTMVHLRWQIGLLGAGIVSDIEHTVYMERYRARANLDGLGVALRGTYKGSEFVWEHKGRMSFSYAQQAKAGSPDAKTRKQVAMQMLLSGFELGSVTNENKDTQDIEEFVIERNIDEIRDAKSELVQLNDAIDKEKLHPMLPECIKQNKTGEFWDCPFGGPGGSCISSGTWPRRIR